MHCAAYVAAASLCLAGAPAGAACLPLLDPAVADLDARADSRPADTLPAVLSRLSSARDPAERLQLQAILSDIYLWTSRAREFRLALGEARETLASLGQRAQAPYARRAAFRLALDRVQTALTQSDKRDTLESLGRLLEEHPAPSQERACVLIFRAEKRSDLGDQTGAAMDGLMAYRMAREHQWDRQLGLAAEILGVVYRRGGLLDEAQIYTDEAVAIAVRSGSSTLKAAAYYFQAHAYLERGQYRAARESAERARSEYMLTGDRFGSRSPIAIAARHSSASACTTRPRRSA